MNAPPDGMTWLEWAQQNPEAYRDAVLDHQWEVAKDARNAEKDGQA